MAIKINPTLKQFYLFLEKNNALIAWENNLLNRNPGRTRAEFLSEILRTGDSYAFIIRPFQWDKTPEGYHYWSKLHAKWQSKLERNN